MCIRDSNMIAHLLSTVPYYEVQRPALQLPSRPPSRGYERPPRDMQTFVPDHASAVLAAAQGSVGGRPLGGGKHGAGVVRDEGLHVPRGPLVAPGRRPRRQLQGWALHLVVRHRGQQVRDHVAVSYTHLTLPTIL